jgi:protein-S-isoprenylcysteine O-methyltransferase Ste14
MPGTPVAEPEVKTANPSARSAKKMVQVLATMGLWIAAVFVSAGRLDWTRGWICVAAYVVTMVAVGVVVSRANPAVMEARANWRRADTKPFDKVFFSFYLPLTFIQPAIAGLDAVRFRWSSMPFAAVYAGLILFWLAMALIAWTMVVNRHAEVTVRIQTDRDHKPVTSGPYRIVRHPMYVGSILMYPATALMLGSKWAVAVSGLIAVLYVWRTAMEDRTLRAELPGYEKFTAVTRYRLIPGLW